MARLTRRFCRSFANHVVCTATAGLEDGACLASAAYTATVAGAMDAAARTVTATLRSALGRPFALLWAGPSLCSGQALRFALGRPF
ncbi:MAG: hypothetical protein JXA14_19400, partial [Anaerolineae bacterium]|nr:hypothetical protein [Anaerolineae bacterium]